MGSRRPTRLLATLIVPVLLALGQADVSYQSSQVFGAHSTAAVWNGVEEAGSRRSGPLYTSYERSDILIAYPVSRDRFKLADVTGAVYEDIRQYVVNCEEARRREVEPTNNTYKFFTCATSKKSPHSIRYTFATPAPLAHLASGGNYKWILFGDDDTLWFVDNVLKMLQGWDYTTPYVISDMFYYRNPCKNCAFDDGRDGAHRGNTHAPRCLPCHFQKPPGWNEPYFPAKVGCPCTRELACSAEPEVCLRRGFDGPSPYGGAGLILSKGLFDYLDVPRLLECCAEYAQTKGHGDDIFMQCVYNQNIAPTDPGPYLHGLQPRFSPYHSAMGMLTELLKCQEPGTKDRCVKKFSKSISLHFTELRMLRHSITAGARLRDALLAAMKVAFTPDEF